MDEEIRRLCARDYRPDRVMLDANSILNAFFNATGDAAAAVEFLVRNNIPIYVCDYALEEAENRVKIGAASLYSDRDTRRQLLRFIDRISATITPVAPVGFLRAINRADEPIARTAKHLGIPLVTDDLGLINEMRLVGVLALQPWSLSRSVIENIGQIVRAERITSCNIGVFARVRVNARFDQGDRPSFIFASEGGANLSLVRSNRSGLLFATYDESVFIPVDFSNETPMQCAIMGRQVGNGISDLLLAFRQGNTAKSSRKIIRHIDLGFAGRFHIGSDQSQSNHLNGAIADLCVYSRYFSPSRFRKAALWPDLIPSLLDDNAVETILGEPLVLAMAG